jgi:hypothetical protein
LEVVLANRSEMQCFSLADLLPRAGTGILDQE